MRHVFALLSVLFIPLRVLADEEPVVITRPTMGLGVEIGALWDERQQSMTGFYLWPADVVQQYTLTTNVRKSDMTFLKSDKMSDRLNFLGIQGQFKITIATGINIEIKGSCSFAMEKKKTSLSAVYAMRYSMRSVYKSVDVFHPAMRSAIYSDILNKKLATHVVTGIVYGGDVVAAFSQTFDSEFSRMDIAASLELNIQASAATIEASASGMYNDTSVNNDTTITVKLFGDLVPPDDTNLPITPGAGLKYIQTIHTKLISEVGVPVTMTMIPIKWLTDSAAALIFAVAEASVNRAMTILQELGDSEVAIRDILLIKSIGFLAWRWDASSYLDDFMGYQFAFTIALVRELKALRETGDPTKLNVLFYNHTQTLWTSGDIVKNLEQRRDNIMNLRAEVSALQVVQVAMAEHYFQYSAPALNRTFAKVYTMVLTGVEADHDTKRGENLGRFYNLAAARLRKTPTNDITHCVEVGSDTGGLTCIENWKFVTIHFDSFCTHFCPEKWCVPTNERAKIDCDATSVDFPSDCWCKNPTAVAVLSDNSAANVWADLPLIPPVPVISKITGDRGVGNIEASPYGQKIKIELVKPNITNILNYQVRVIWFTARVSGAGGVTWVRQQRTFETRGRDNTIVVANLTSGEQYRFQVAAKTDVGTSAFSTEFPTEFIQVSTNTVLLYKLGDLSRSITEVPNWGSISLTVEVSKELTDPIGSVKFFINGMQIDCIIDDPSKATARRVNCTLTANTLATETTTARVLVYSISDDNTLQGYAAQTIGDIIMLAPSVDACKKWSHAGSLYCNLAVVDKAKCVTSCTNCGISYNGWSLTTANTNNAGSCEETTRSAQLQYSCQTLVEDAWYKGYDENKDGFPVIRTGLIYKVKAQWKGGGISQRQWTYRSTIGWKQTSCSTALGWPLYSPFCVPQVLVAFQMRGQTAALGTFDMVKQPTILTVAPECTIPDTNTSDLTCRLRTEAEMRSGTDKVFPRLVGASYEGTVNFRLIGCGVFV